jgi:hypothetical protein
MKLSGVQWSILGLWQYTDCSVSVLASILIVLWTCIPPSNEGGYDVYWTSYLTQCFGCLTRKKIILCMAPLPREHLVWSHFHLKELHTIRAACPPHVSYIWQYTSSTTPSLMTVTLHDLCDFRSHTFTTHWAGQNSQRDVGPKKKKKMTTYHCSGILTIPSKLANFWDTTLGYQKVHSQWVPHLLTHSKRHMSLWLEYLQQYHSEGVFLWCTVADETMCHHSEPTEKSGGMQCRHPTSPRQKKSQPSVGKVVINCVLWQWQTSVPALHTMYCNSAHCYCHTSKAVHQHQ